MQSIAKVIIKNASNANERQDFWEKAELNLLMDFKRVLNVCRGSAIFCQIIVQSIPQLQDRYPNTEWEELIGCTDRVDAERCRECHRRSSDRRETSPSDEGCQEAAAPCGQRVFR